MLDFQNLKSRFCPSPTGRVHIGNIRTALFNALVALKYHGKFLLRIEDTDLVRSSHENTLFLFKDLLWLGLKWDEGPDIKTQAIDNMYWQSQRGEIYEQYYKKLIDMGLCYPCFCSEEELMLNRKICLSRGQPPRYDGKCRNLPKEEVERRIKNGEKFALRFHVPQNEKIEFTDLVHGPQVFETNNIGDFIIKKKDGSSSFIFCNAIDDSLMKVNCAIRGDDHLTNTPRQILILQKLGMPVPVYGHISLILGNDGNPLSKRNGSMSICDLRDLGYLPVAICNYLARLGHTYAENKLYTLEELGANFQIESLGKSPSRFDIKQLDYWQKKAVENLGKEEFITWSRVGQIPEEKSDLFWEAMRAIVLFPKESQAWWSVFFGDFNLKVDQNELFMRLKQNAKYFAILQENLEKTAGDIDVKKVLSEIGKALNIKGKDLYLPIREALTAKTHGPEMTTIFKLLDRDTILKRINAILE